MKRSPGPFAREPEASLLAEPQTQRINMLVKYVQAVSPAGIFHQCKWVATEPDVGIGFVNSWGAPRSPTPLTATARFLVQ
jgi:hypothetical protein